MTGIDYAGIFTPSLGILNVILRGSIMYLALFAILRFIARRQAGSFGPADLLVIVLIADAAQNALGKEYGSVTEGIALVMTIVAWEYLFDWLAWRYPKLRPLIKAPSLVLVHNGRFQEAALRSEMLTEEELRGQLREHGVEDERDVKIARVEGDGRLSVLRRSREP